MGYEVIVYLVCVVYKGNEVDELDNGQEHEEFDCNVMMMMMMMMMMMIVKEVMNKVYGYEGQEEFDCNVLMMMMMMIVEVVVNEYEGENALYNIAQAE